MLCGQLVGIGQSAMSMDWLHFCSLAGKTNNRTDREQQKVIDCLKRFFFEIEMMIEAVTVEVGANIV